jgi:hypothetical protein
MQRIILGSDKIMVAMQGVGYTFPVLSAGGTGL